MKKIYAFLLTSVGAAMLLPLLTTACDSASAVVNCLTDADCGADESCLTISDNSACTATDETECSCVGAGVGEGEGEGGEGEGGEGEGAGGDCPDLGAGNGLLVDEVDLDTSAGTDCTIAGTSDYDLTVFIPTAGQPGTWDGTVSNADWLTMATSGAADSAVFAANSCNGGAVACVNDDASGDCDGTTDCACACLLCLSETPPDLAVSIHNDAGDESDGVCAVIDGG